MFRVLSTAKIFRSAFEIIRPMFVAHDKKICTTPLPTLFSCLSLICQQGAPRRRKRGRSAASGNFRDVKPLAKIVLVAGFEAFNLELYRQVVGAGMALVVCSVIFMCSDD